MEGIPWLHHIRDKRLLKQRTQTASTYFQIFYWRRYWIRAAKFERRVAVSIFPHWIKFNGILFCLISFLVSSRGLIWSPRNDLVGTALVRQIFYPRTICSHHFAKWNFLFFCVAPEKVFDFSGCSIDETKPFQGRSLGTFRKTALIVNWLCNNSLWVDFARLFIGKIFDRKISRLPPPDAIIELIPHCLRDWHTWVL